MCVLTLCLGKVHCVDEHGRSSPVLSVDGSIQKLFYLKRREVLAVVTETLLLSQYTLGPEGGPQELMKVHIKLYFSHFLFH